MGHPVMIANDPSPCNQKGVDLKLKSIEDKVFDYHCNGSEKFAT